MVTGARGTGKTYGLLKYLVSNGVRFLYLRRLKTQLDECGSIESNPFKKLNTDTGECIIPYHKGNSIRFCPSEMTAKGKYSPIDEPIALGVALSTFASVRGADFSDYDCIVFDEAIPMIGEKPIQDEFKAFLNFYETVNRNRELEGHPSVKCFLLGNANRLGNPYYTGWGFMSTALKMISGNQMMYRTPDNSRLMVMLLDSPISAKKRKTALYRNGNDDFITMALDNAFRTDATNTNSRPIKQYTHIVSVGEIGIYRHKSNGQHYVSKVISKNNYYDGFGIKLTMFKNDYGVLKILYLNNRIVFENYQIQLMFREYFDLI